MVLVGLPRTGVQSSKGHSNETKATLYVYNRTNMTAIVAMDSFQITSLVVTYLIVVIQFHQNDDVSQNVTWYLAQVEDDVF